MDPSQVNEHVHQRSSDLLQRVSMPQFVGHRISELVDISSKHYCEFCAHSRWDDGMHMNYKGMNIVVEKHDVRCTLRDTMVRTYFCCTSFEMKDDNQ